MNLRVAALLAALATFSGEASAGWRDAIIRGVAARTGIFKSSADDVARLFIVPQKVPPPSVLSPGAFGLKPNGLWLPTPKLAGSGGDDALSFMVGPKGLGKPPLFELRPTGIQSVKPLPFELPPPSIAGARISLPKFEPLVVKKPAIPDGVPFLQESGGQWHFRAAGGQALKPLESSVKLQEFLATMGARGPPEAAAALHVPEAAFAALGKLTYAKDPKIPLRILDSTGEVWKATWIKASNGFVPAAELAPGVFVRPEAFSTAAANKLAIRSASFEAKQTKVLALFDRKSSPATFDSLQEGTKAFRGFECGANLIPSAHITKGQPLIVIGHREGEFLVVHDGAGAVMAKISISELQRQATEKGASLLILACKAGQLEGATGPLVDIVSTRLAGLLGKAALEKTQLGMLRALASADYPFCVATEFFHSPMVVGGSGFFSHLASTARSVTFGAKHLAARQPAIEYFFVTSTPWALGVERRELLNRWNLR